jgi:uncharacterized membrane protein
MKNILIIFGFFIFSLQSCYYDNVEELYPEITNGCNTTNVSFSKDVKKIIDSRCIGCHSTVNYITIGGGVALEGFENVKTSADNGGLLGSITHDSGYSKMPKGSSKMDDCKIKQIKKWIEDGAKNN